MNDQRQLKHSIRFQQLIVLISALYETKSRLKKIPDFLLKIITLPGAIKSNKSQCFCLSYNSIVFVARAINLLTAFRCGSRKSIKLIKMSTSPALPLNNCKKLFSSSFHPFQFRTQDTTTILGIYYCSSLRS